MARPPIAGPDETTKEFIVAAGCSIGGFDGKRKHAGDTIELTREQAQYYMRRGMIDLDLPDFDNKDTDYNDGKGTDNEDPGKPTDGDKTEAGAGDQVEGEGVKASGDSSAKVRDAAGGNSASRRGKGSL